MAKTELFVRQQKGGMFTVVNESLTTGNIFFVNSGAGNQGGNTPGYGQNPDKPFLTLAYAVTQCTANNGDRIYVMPGHAEAVIAAGGIDLDVAGVTVIGLGVGRNRPTINFTTDVDADIDVTANNVTLENMVFDMSGIDDLVAGLDVAGTDFTLKDSEIIMTVGAAQADEAINIGNAADRALIENCIISAPDAGAEAAINIGAAAAIVDNVSIKNTVVRGDFSNAPIYSAGGAEHTNTLVEECTLVNANAGNYALEFTDAATGQVVNNKLVSDAIATALEPQACACFGNLYYDSDDSDVNGTPIPTAVTTGGASLQAIQTITDSLQGRVRELSIQVEADCSNWTTGASPIDIFTVTGDVLVRCFGTVQTGITSTSDDGTLELGVEDNTAVLIAQTIAAGTATRLDAGDVWTGAASDEKALAVGNADWFIVAGGANIILTVATNSMTAGAATIYCEWLPLSGNGNVVPA